MSLPARIVSVDKFCHRQFPLSHADLAKSYSGTKFLDHTAEQFEALVNTHISAHLQGDQTKLSPGYAPFCKHVFMPNVAAAKGRLTNATVNTVGITEENEGLLRTEYEARTPKELPVLTRYFPSSAINPSDLPVATFIDVILYSREQIRKENAAMGDEPNDEAAPWGVVSIKPQLVDYELPMNPITAMRNALGEEYGGSGKEIDLEEYLQAVNFWKVNAIVK